MFSVHLSTHCLTTQYHAKFTEYNRSIHHRCKVVMVLLLLLLLLLMMMMMMMMM